MKALRVLVSVVLLSAVAMDPALATRERELDSRQGCPPQLIAAGAALVLGTVLGIGYYFYPSTKQDAPPPERFAEIHRDMEDTVDRATIVLPLAEGMSRLTEKEAAELFEQTTTMSEYIGALGERLELSPGATSALSDELKEVLLKNEMDPAKFRATSSQSAQKLVRYLGAGIALRAQRLLTINVSLVGAKATVLTQAMDVFVSDPEGELDFLTAQGIEATAGGVGTTARLQWNLEKLALKVKAHLMAERTKQSAGSLRSRVANAWRNWRGGDEAPVTAESETQSGDPEVDVVAPTSEQP